MSKQKITILVVAIILVLTAIILGVKMAKRDSSDLSRVPASNGKTANPNEAVAPSVAGGDAELKDMEKELNSASDADLGDDNLSDQAVGLQQ
jgi:hypothetical protein